MAVPTTKDELTAIFRRFGARDPELWASSQADEGIPQLARFLFMRAAWEHIPREGDSSWIDREIKSSTERPTLPYAGLGKALALCREKGVPDSALTEIARCLQASMLFTVGYVIDGPAYSYTVEGLSWSLFQVDEEGKPFGEPVSGLHESVLEFDPTGREMRPLGDA
jgi:hypothetical protein